MNLKICLFYFLTNVSLVSYSFGSPLTIQCGSQQYHFGVEQALTYHEHQMGLMNRPHLPEDQGMVFSYDTPQPVAMWMKNTLIPLDMIFCDEQGNILEIHENAIPHSLQNIGPIENTSHVLEINGGLIKKHGITKECTLSFDR